MTTTSDLHRGLTRLILAGSCLLVCHTAAFSTPSEEVIFGGDANYPPFEWDENGSPTGFNIDLEDALAEAGQARAVHRLYNWPDAVQALEDGGIDVLPMFVSEERAQRFRFTSAFYYVNHAVYAAAGTPSVSSVRDLDGRTVAIERSSYAHARLEREPVTPTLVLVGNTRAALEAVVRGEADYALLAAPTAESLIHRYDYDLASIGPPFWAEAYAFAVRRDREDLAEWVEQSLDITIGSGRFKEIEDRWRGDFTPGEYGVVAILTDVLMVAAPLTVFVALGYWRLCRTVANRTRRFRMELRRRRAAETQVRYFADHDAHTDLPEYPRFVELADSVLQSVGNALAKEVAVLKLAEIEAVARTFGFSVGQEVVRSFSARLRAHGFDACGYLGRGVFAIIGPRNAVKTGFEMLTARLTAAEASLYPQVVAGISYWPDHADTAADLVRRAETAMAAGVLRNQALSVYEPSMEPDELDIQIVTEFRKSDGSDLRVVLQPQIELSSGRIVAAEALVRWSHAELGVISPGKFIPLLEKAGLIGRVTTRMIDEAVRIAARLRRHHQPCAISVNIAVYDLLATDLPAIIREALARHDGRPEDIKLELTETGVAQDPHQVKLVLEQLKAAGIDSAIDDFGTGYSSLHYLSAFPIQELKIDQSFVTDMLTNERNHSIVRSTIALAGSLGLTVVAEGAEDMATVEALKGLGCDRVQGYVISKPLPEAEFIDCLGSHVAGSPLRTRIATFGQTAKLRVAE